MLESLLLSRQRSAVTSRQPLPFSSIPACSVFLFPKPSTVRRTSKAFVLLIRSRLLCAGPVLERTLAELEPKLYHIFIKFYASSLLFLLLLFFFFSFYLLLLFFYSALILHSLFSSSSLLPLLHPFCINSSSSKYLLVTPLVLKSYRRPCSYVVQCILL